MFSVRSRCLLCMNGRHTGRAHSEYQHQCKDMEGRVVVATAALGPARRTLFVLPAEQLCAQQVGGYVGPRHAWTCSVTPRCRIPKSKRALTILFTRRHCG